MTFRSLYSIAGCAALCLLSNVALAAAAPNPPLAFCVNSACAKVTSTTTGVKWHPGHYSLSGTIAYAANSSSALSSIESDMSNDFSSTPTLQGVMILVAWDVLEDTQSNYTFSLLDQIRTYMATNFPGKRLGIQIMATNYFGLDCTGYIPSYILNNPGTYGPGADGTHGGYWTVGLSSTPDSCKPAIWRASVMSRLEALYRAMAAHPSPYSSGYTYDTDPYVEVICYDEASIPFLSGSNGPPDFTLSTYVTLWEQLQAAIVASWPHTNVADLNNFWAYGSSANALTVTIADMAIGVAASSPDTYYPLSSNGTWGQQAYAGLVSSSSNWVGKGAAINLVEYPDYGTGGVQTLFTAATAQAPNGVGASEIWWDDDFGNWQSTVAPFIASNPIPSANTACPPIYTSVRGGCNTN